MARNWADMGITWHTTTVRREKGTVTRAGAEVPEVVDGEKFAAALVEAGSSLTNVVNASNSPTVRAQAVARNTDLVGETLREAVWRAIVGMRSEYTTRTVTVERVVLPLPNGSKYDGNDRMEYMQLWMAAAVDVGMDAGMARVMADSMANTREWPQAQ